MYQPVELSVKVVVVGGFVPYGSPRGLNSEIIFLTKLNKSSFAKILIYSHFSSKQLYMKNKQTL